MRALTTSIVLFAALLYSCVGEDVNDDFVQPEIKILNPLESITVGQSHQYDFRYTNNVGTITEASVTWSSNNSAVITINELGFLEAVGSGSAEISVQLANDGSVFAIDQVIVNDPPDEGPIDDPIDEVVTRTGSIRTTSSYELAGDFTLSEGTVGVILEIAENYVADDGLPGLYIYLTNNPNTNAGAYEIGPVTVFQGAHTYVIEEAEVGLNTYDYVLYYCKPFTVKVGDGEFDN